MVFVIISYVSCISAYGQIQQQTIHINQGSSSPSNFEFYSQPYIEVQRSDSISWNNDDSVKHTITFADTNALRTGLGDDTVAPGDSIIYHFNAPGVYDYYDRFYPFMTGRVVVR